MSNAPKTEKSRLRASESPTLPKALIVWVILVLVIWGFLLLAISPIPMWLDSALLSLLKSWGTQELYLRALVYSVMLASVITVIRLAWVWGKKIILGPGGVPSILRLAIVWGILAIIAPIILFYFFGRKAQARDYIWSLGLVTAIVGGWVATKRGHIAEEQQRMETFTRAVEQISNKEKTIAIAGLQILARLAKKNQYDPDFITRIGNFLQSYINSIVISVREVKSDPSAKDKRKPELEATAIRILGDVTQLARDLSTKSEPVHPQFVILIDTYLKDAILSGANLQGAYLLLANLQEAHLLLANLQDANLQDANLQGAQLQGTKLQGAQLQGVKLQKAEFYFKEKGMMKGTNVSGADFRGAKCYETTGESEKEKQAVTRPWLQNQGAVADNWDEIWTDDNPPPKEKK